MDLERQFKWVYDKIESSELKLEAKISSLEKKLNTLLLRDAKLQGAGMVAGFVGGLIMTIVLKLWGLG